MRPGPRLAARLATFLAIVGAGLLFLRFVYGTQTGAALAAHVPASFWAGAFEIFGTRDAESAQMVESLLIFGVGAGFSAVVVLVVGRAWTALRRSG